MLLGLRGTPLTPGGLGRPRSQTPKGYEAPPASPKKSGRCGAQPARSPACERHLPVACTRVPAECTRHVPAACTRHVPAMCNRHVLRRATSMSCGVQPARLAACSRHVLRRATGTSLRRAICAVRRTQTRARARDLERVIATLRLSARLRAKFAISRSVSFFNLSVFDSGF